MRKIQQQLETWESSQHAQDSVPAIPTENNLHHYYKCQSVDVLRETIVASNENYTKHINTLHSKIQSVLRIQNVVHLFTTELQMVNPQ